MAKELIPIVLRSVVWEPYPQVSRFPTPLPPSPFLIRSVPSQARLDIPKLQGVLQRYYLSGIAPTTRNTYVAGQKQYKFFCSHANKTLTPTSESTLLLLISHLTTLNLSHTIINSLSLHCMAYAYHCRVAFQLLNNSHHSYSKGLKAKN